MIQGHCILGSVWCSQVWFETDRNELVLATLLCLDASETFPKLGKCHEMGGDQEWKHRGTVSNDKLRFRVYSLGMMNNIECV
jgi:hypothetical protein